jgi:hypothetical protein
MPQPIQAVALGAFYGMVPAFLDKRGAIVSLMSSSLADPAAAMEFGLSGIGTSVVPEDIVLTSPLRRCRLNISPSRFMLSSESLGFDDFGALAAGVHARMADLYKDVGISYLGAVVRVSGVKSKAPLSEGAGPMEVSVAGVSLPNVTEFRSTTFKQGWRQHILVRPVGIQLSEVTLDLQKVEAAVWSDVPALLSQSKSMLEELVAKMESV